MGPHVIILWTLLVGFLGVFAVTYRSFTYWRGKGIPYITSLPFVGIFLPIFLRLQSLPDILQKVYNKYPSSKYLGFVDGGGIPAIMIKDPEIIKDIGVKNFDNFPNHRAFVEESFDPLLSRNLFSLKDSRWRDMRSTLSPSFTANKMKYIFTLVSQCSMGFVQHLKDHPNLIKEFDMKDAFTRFTNDVIATAAFGISVDSMKDRDNEFYVHGKSASSFGLLRFFTIMFSLIAPKIMRLMGFTFLPKKANNFFKKIVYDTIRSREEKGIVRPDMIHLLMQARDNEKNVNITNDGTIKITNDDIIAQAVLFFLAGFDTSSRLMCYVAHTLAHHPDVQAKLWEEISTILAEDKGVITYETLGKMKYLDMVISETLRLYPPQPFLDRICSKEFTLPPAMEDLKEFTVEPKSMVWLPVFTLHRDPEYFPDPNKFDPERFNVENRNEINPYAYMPFGVGPRKCIGERFALMETKIVIVNLLQNFVFKPSTKSPKDIDFSKKDFDMIPANGFWMILERRK